jgi:Ca2+/Na+ antiporter
MIGKQAMILTYNDAFYVIAVFFALCIPLLALFIRRKKKVEAGTLAALGD